MISIEAILSNQFKQLYNCAPYLVLTAYTVQVVMSTMLYTRDSRNDESSI